MTEYAIIVAGGAGSRMKSSIPKQFMPINGTPILMHTIQKFYTYSTKTEIITVLPEFDIDRWQSLCKKHNFAIPHHIVAGGNTRFQSVRNGIKSIKEEIGLVAIHDGVRPLVSTETIKASYSLAQLHGSAIASVGLKESIRIIGGNTTKSLDRSNFRLIQTPQTFQLELIKGAYDVEERPEFTDDASVAENYGIRIHLFEGEYQNIKITTPEDIKIAESMIN